MFIDRKLGGVLVEVRNQSAKNPWNRKLQQKDIMACATLKRSLDWESLNQRPTKRRRCHPFGSPSSNAPNSPSSSAIAAAAAASSSNSAMRVMEPKPSPFAEAVCPKLTPGKFLFPHFMHFKCVCPTSFCWLGTPPRRRQHTVGRMWFCLPPAFGQRN